jgi:hypothetical protein
VGLAWSKDAERYAGGSLTTGGVSSAGWVKGDAPDIKEYPGPPGWGLGEWLHSYCGTASENLHQNLTWQEYFNRKISKYNF